jgi:hypothetical protein
MWYCQDYLKVMNACLAPLYVVPLLSLLLPSRLGLALPLANRSLSKSSSHCLFLRRYVRSFAGSLWTSL